MTPLSFERMSREEKLRMLRELWDSIAREGDRYESPSWHEQALKETQQRYESGTEQDHGVGRRRAQIPELIWRWVANVLQSSVS